MKYISSLIVNISAFIETTYCSKAELEHAFRISIKTVIYMSLFG